MGLQVGAAWSLLRLVPVKTNCRRNACHCSISGLKTGHWESQGRYYRKSDSKWVARFRCRNCRTSISDATFHPCFRQRKRRINEPLFRLLCSGVSLRRSARILGVHRTTVVRKFRFLAEQARLNQKQFWKKIGESNPPITEVQLDDMETFEHTKLKPLSITMAVTRERRILGAFVASMPAKGLIAKRSVDKYGKRPDRRRKALSALFRSIKPMVIETALFQSDRNPQYPETLKRHFPNAIHHTTKGLRGCVTGQGELKAALWDPLFSFNHTAAMLRANMNRLFRQTWCTTKTIRGLKDHLAIYIDFHNQILVEQ